MSRTKIACIIVVVAAALGIAGDALLHATPWGINALLWAVLIGSTTTLLLHRVRSQSLGMIVPQAITASVAAAGLAWRDSGTLNALDVMSMLGFLALLALPPRGVRLAVAGFLETAGALALTALQSIVGFFQLLFIDLPWRETPVGAVSRRSLIIARGIAVAVPALLLFGGLFMAADSAFSSIVQNLFAIDFAVLLGHLGFMIAIAIPTAAFLHSALLGGELKRFTRPEFVSLACVEMNIAMALIDILFAAFVAVQFRYLFGGADLVRVAPHLTYAQYARSGFFQLVWVVGLVLPLLLFSEWLIDKSDGGAVRTFRMLAGVQVLLTLIVAFSAYKRMALYVSEYGLTELRLYTTSFLCWLALLLGWFAATVLFGRRPRFLVGALATALAVLVTLHALNPDDLIVRTNTARVSANGARLDLSYAMSLGADAVPALLDALPALALSDQPCAARHILRLDGKWSDDPRSWNIGRATAHAATAARRAALTQLASGCTRR